MNHGWERSIDSQNIFPQVHCDPKCSISRCTTEIKCDDVTVGKGQGRRIGSCRSKTCLVLAVWLFRCSLLLQLLCKPALLPLLMQFLQKALKMMKAVAGRGRPWLLFFRAAAVIVCNVCLPATFLPRYLMPPFFNSFVSLFAFSLVLWRLAWHVRPPAS